MSKIQSSLYQNPFLSLLKASPSPKYNGPESQSYFVVFCPLCYASVRKAGMAPQPTRKLPCGHAHNTLPYPNYDFLIEAAKHSTSYIRASDWPKRWICTQVPIGVHLWKSSGCPRGRSHYSLVSQLQFLKEGESFAIIWKYKGYLRRENTEEEGYLRPWSNLVLSLSFPKLD